MIAVDDFAPEALSPPEALHHRNMQQLQAAGAPTDASSTAAPSPERAQAPSEPFAGPEPVEAPDPQASAPAKRACASAAKPEPVLS